jgi:hypothetical protein
MVVVRLLRFFGKIRLNNQTNTPIVLKSKAPDLWVHGSCRRQGMESFFCKLNYLVFSPENSCIFVGEIST